MIRPSLLGFIESPHFGLALILIKVSILFGAGFLLAYLLRRRSAEVRHFIWVATLLGALAVPVMTFVLPHLEWKVLSSAVAPPVTTNIQPDFPRSALSHEMVTGALPSTVESVPAAGPILTVTRIWLLGALFVLVWCAIGHLALARMARRARPVTDDSWLALLQNTSRTAKLKRPVRLLTSPSINSPMTWGLRRPIVFLPEAAASWPLERRRVVLLHELAHIARMDFVVQLLASMTCALYWFHPGAWGAARRLRHESEHACDDRAIVLGTPAADYASHLLCLALQSNARHWHEAMAVGLTRPSTLEARVRAVLNEDLTRRALSPRLRLAGSIVLGACVLMLSALTPVRAALTSAVLEGPPVYSPHPLAEAAASCEKVEAVAPPEEATTVEETKAAEEAALEDAVQAMKDAALASGKTVSRTVEAIPGERLDLRLLAGGNVDIEGWDESQVRVVAHIQGPDAGKIEVEVDRTPNGIQVNAFFAQHSGVETSSNEFQIQVPRKFDVRLHSSGGGLHMSNVEGTFEGDTGGGEIVLEHVKGHASLSTGGSDIRVTDSHLSGDVSTGGGTVDLIRVHGGLVGSSGSGPVRSHDSMKAAELDKLSQELTEEMALHSKELAENSKELTERAKELTERSAELALRAVEMSKSGGGITLTEIPRGATLSTGGGDIEIGTTSGPVIVSTGGGDMKIGPVNGSLDASTGAGDVRVTVAATDETIEVTSGSGKVVLELPAAFHGKIELETGYTKSFGRAATIDSDFTLQRESTTEWDGSGGQTPRRYVRAHGTLGEGRGRVRVTTVNGDIILRRARQ